FRSWPARHHAEDVVAAMAVHRGSGTARSSAGAGRSGLLQPGRHGRRRHLERDRVEGHWGREAGLGVATTYSPGDRRDDAGRRAGHDTRRGDRLSPAFTLDRSGGQVMITRFECPGLPAMVIIVLLHRWIKRQVARRADGYLGAAMVRDWRTRTVLSMSLWRD